MKIKNKGKVYPSPSSSSSSPPSDGGYLSVLKLLPAAILALASVLSLDDREVLAYLITRSIKTTATATVNPSSSIIQKKSSKNKTANGSTVSNATVTAHKPPVFYCDCFDCYMSYWFRWDSSPNRELIHQAIEAFEDHLTNGETEKSKKNGKGKRRDKTTRRSADTNKHVVDITTQPEVSVLGNQVEESQESSSAAAVVVPETLPENDVALVPVSSSEEEASRLEENEVVEVSGESAAVEEETSALVRTSTAASSCSHKGLARKVLPDVLGLFNSRLWSLWSPNV
ncbi:ATP-dependent tryptophan/phenylalanine/tyrosine adenylase [Melia azedarach]|uniref:ATP-dependent tryptophan/phenylalanine/tyrosine adenylase n=1 Tax=Melia azedarach TaxID=155640 RepID=A0ACC1XH08_MELAZ|nr:ATP-dependent tryptophan/phenylalanine/tyrosine adenylase [Melia azedarach]